MKRTRPDLKAASSVSNFGHGSWVYPPIPRNPYLYPKTRDKHFRPRPECYLFSWLGFSRPEPEPDRANRSRSRTEPLEPDRAVRSRSRSRTELARAGAGWSSSRPEPELDRAGRSRSRPEPQPDRAGRSRNQSRTEPAGGGAGAGCRKPASRPISINSRMPFAI